jgi:hypothetical protein
MWNIIDLDIWDFGVSAPTPKFNGDFTSFFNYVILPSLFSNKAVGSVITFGLVGLNGKKEKTPRRKDSNAPKKVRSFLTRSDRCLFTKRI